MVRGLSHSHLCFSISVSLLDRVFRSWNKFLIAMQLLGVEYSPNGYNISRSTALTYCMGQVHCHGHAAICGNYVLCRFIRTYLPQALIECSGRLRLHNNNEIHRISLCRASSNGVAAIQNLSKGSRSGQARTSFRSIPMAMPLSLSRARVDDMGTASHSVGKIWSRRRAGPKINLV